jgi:hypothetical protein
LQSDCKVIAKRLQSDYKATANRLQSDCKAIAKRLRIDCESIAKRLQSFRNHLIETHIFRLSSSSNRFKVETSRTALASEVTTDLIQLVHYFRCSNLCLYGQERASTAKTAFTTASGEPLLLQMRTSRWVSEKGEVIGGYKSEDWFTGEKIRCCCLCRCCSDFSVISPDFESSLQRLSNDCEVVVQQLQVVVRAIKWMLFTQRFRSDVITITQRFHSHSMAQRFHSNSTAFSQGLRNDLKAIPHWFYSNFVAFLQHFRSDSTAIPQRLYGDLKRFHSDFATIT